MPPQSKKARKKKGGLDSVAPSKFKKRGATSNTYLNLLLKNKSKLTKLELEEMAILIRDSHRITPIGASKAAEGRTVFNSVTGHHEWLPTDRALKIINGSAVWQYFYTALRSPTWLLVVNPDRFCIDRGEYVSALEKAAAGTPVPASALGLVGHSGGLCDRAGTQLTTHQSTWHDELRDIYDEHAASNAYESYWVDLQDFIGRTFLFAASSELPLCGADIGKTTNEDLMRRIRWDLNLSGRGNPTDLQPTGDGDPPALTLYDIADFLRAQWRDWGAALRNSYSAHRCIQT
jgi:hypothetical protein